MIQSPINYSTISEEAYDIISTNTATYKRMTDDSNKTIGVLEKGDLGTMDNSVMDKGSDNKYNVALNLIDSDFLVDFKEIINNPTKYQPYLFQRRNLIIDIDRVLVDIIETSSYETMLSSGYKARLQSIYPKVSFHEITF